MKAVLAIIKKEFSRFFRDRRMVITTIFLPGLILYAMYTAIGAVTKSMTSAADVPVVYVQNMPLSLSEGIESMLDVREQTVYDEQAKEQIAGGEVAALIIFPSNFDDLTVSTAPPEVKIYYCSSDSTSSAAYTMMTSLLDMYEDSIANVFNVNASADEKYDLADSQSVGRQVLSTVVPLVLIMLMLSGCVSVVLESIAGEKERGTIATLLVTPIKRSSLAVGKIVSLSVISILSGISSFIGLMLSLPNLMSGSGVDLSLAAYGPLEYLGVFSVVISTVLVYVGLLSIVSAYAKSTKEANGLIAPVMIVSMICALGSMFLGSPAIGFYFIPVLNSALCISALMAGTFTAAAFIVTMCVNLVCAAILAVLLGVMFNSEKIMFNS